jgi:hypothetical protein
LAVRCYDADMVLVGSPSESVHSRSEARLGVVCFGFLAALSLIPGCFDFSDPPSVGSAARDGGTGPEGTADSAAADSDASGGVSVIAPLATMPGQLAIRVDAVRQLATKGAKGPLLISVALANGAGGKPVPLLDQLFRLTLSDGRLRAPMAVDDSVRAWVNGSTPVAGDLLAGGGLFAFQLAFEIGNVTGLELTFAPAATDDSRSASARVTSIEPCTMCGDTCTYLDRDRANCGKCGSHYAKASDGPATCSGGKWTCTSAGQSTCENQGATTCADLTTGKIACGSCATPVLSGAQCTKGRLTCMNSNEVLCADGCKALDSDKYNCGACGKMIAYNSVCIGGEMVCTGSTLNGIREQNCDNLGICVDTTVSDTNCGRCGNKCKGGTSCNKGYCD